MKNYQVFYTTDFKQFNNIGQRNRSVHYESTLEEWVENYPQKFLGDDIIIISRQYTLPSNHRIDLLGIDSEGNIIIVELKRAAANPDVLTQALSYAEEIRDYSKNKIMNIYAEYSNAKQCEYNSLESACQNRFGVDINDMKINEKQILILVSFDFNERDIRAARYLTATGSLVVKLVELVSVPLDEKHIFIATQLVRYEETEKKRLYNEKHHIGRIKYSEVEKIYKKIIALFANYKCGIKHTELYTSAKYNSYTIVRVRVKPRVISYITVFCSYTKKKDIERLLELKNKHDKIKLEFAGNEKKEIKSIKFLSINTLNKFKNIYEELEKALKNRIDIENSKLNNITQKKY